MKTSEDINELATAFAKAQSEMKSASFDKVNPHFKNRYASLQSFIAACKDHLNKYGLSFTQPSYINGLQTILETVIMHSSGPWMSGEMLIIPGKGDIQSFGSSMTYAKRYLLSAMLGIAADDDDDGEEAMAPPPPATPKKAAPPIMPTKEEIAHYHELYAKISPEAKALVDNYLKKAGLPADKLSAFDLGQLKKSMIKNLPKEPAIEEEVPF